MTSRRPHRSCGVADGWTAHRSASPISTLPPPPRWRMSRINWAIAARPRATYSRPRPWRTPRDSATCSSRRHFRPRNPPCPWVETLVRRRWEIRGGSRRLSRVRSTPHAQRRIRHSCTSPNKLDSTLALCDTPCSGGLDLTGKAAVLKTAGRKPLQVRILCPPLRLAEPALGNRYQLPATSYRCKRSGGREAEGGGLLNRYRVEKPYRGFESLPLRLQARRSAGGPAFFVMLSSPLCRVTAWPPTPRLAFDSRPRPRAFCTWGAPARRSSTGSMPASSAGSSCCASKTPTARAAPTRARAPSSR